MRLVLGPSLGTSAATLWGACVDAMRRLDPDLEVLTWDLPGHGPSGGRDVAPDLTVADLAARVLDSVEGDFCYAGDSVGGAVGLQLCLDAPERVRALVVLCSGARIGTAESWTERAEQVRALGTSSLVAASAQRWFAPGFLEREPARGSALLHALRDADDAGYAAVCHALGAFDVRDRLGDVTVPVLAVAGAHDVATPPERLREIADGVADGRLVVLDDIAHLAPAEAPEPVARLIVDHLRGVPA